MLDGTDSHLYFGWYHGDERDLPGFAASMPRMVRFVSEFGAQAVPAAADFMEPDRWPDLDWERLQERHGLQLHAFERLRSARRLRDVRRSGATRRSGTRPTLLRHHIETLRRLKYQPTGGFCFFMFNDAAPDGVVERARPRAPSEAGLPGRRRRLPPGDRRRRPAARHRVGRRRAGARRARRQRRAPAARRHGVHREAAVGRAGHTRGVGAATFHRTHACASAPSSSSSPISPASCGSTSSSSTATRSPPTATSAPSSAEAVAN